MTQEEKELLTKDLCSRLDNHSLLVKYGEEEYNIIGISFGRVVLVKPIMSMTSCSPLIEEVKPYLRPMSSMTEEEGEKLEQIAKETLGDFMFEAEEDGGAIYHMTQWKTLSPAMFDYLNSIHIDYRGLIGKGLALEAPDGMYIIK